MDFKNISCEYELVAVVVYLHCWNSPWRSFLADEPMLISKSKRRFVFCCFIYCIVLRECLSLLVWKRKVKVDLLFSVSCFSLSCACLYCPPLTNVVLACGKDLRLLATQPSTEEYVNSGGAEATADVHSSHLCVRIKEVCWNSDV